MIGHLARAAIAGELDIRPVRVSTNSEPLSEEDRDAIDTAWGARPPPLGLDPRSLQAIGCATDGLHVSDCVQAASSASSGHHGDGLAAISNPEISMALLSRSRVKPRPANSSDSSG